MCYENRHALALFGRGSACLILIGLALAVGLLSCVAPRPVGRSRINSKPSPSAPIGLRVGVAPPAIAVQDGHLDSQRSSVAEPAPEPQPIRELEELAIEGFQPALVSLPARYSSSPGSSPSGAPLLVVTHGAGGTADWHCQHWRLLTHARVYVLCLAGKRINSNPRIDNGYYYPDHHALGRELDAAMQAFRGKYPTADMARPTYAGYSQGATMGALMLVQRPSLFARIVLVEGGYSEWNRAQARILRSSGAVERVLWVCGQSNCVNGASASTAWLLQVGIDARVQVAHGAGHTPSGEVSTKTVEALPWLFEGDPRW